MIIGKKLGAVLAGTFIAAVLIASGGQVFAEADMSNPNCDTAILDSEEFCNLNDNDGQGIYNLLALVINILTGAIGVACTIGLVMAGIMWGTASGDVGRVKLAQKRIIEIVTGMVVLALMWAFLNFLIPGGVFN